MLKVIESLATIVFFIILAFSVLTLTVNELQKDNEVCNVYKA